VDETIIAILPKYSHFAEIQQYGHNGFRQKVIYSKMAVIIDI